MTDWLTAKQVAARTGTSVEHLRRLRHEKKGFPYYKPSPRVVLYDADEVEASIRATRVDVRDSFTK